MIAVHESIRARTNQDGKLPEWLDDIFLCYEYLLQHSHAHVVIDLQENNFKAVLESIRDLMNEETVLPEWLHDIFLGYGDPAAAQYNKLPSTMRALDFKV